MPRLETPIGRDGPIVDVRIWIGPEHEEALKLRGYQTPRPLSVSGLLDTGAQMTAIQQVLAQGMGLPVHDWVGLRSSVLGAEERDAPIYLMRMTFGSIENPNPPKWRIIGSVGVGVRQSLEQKVGLSPADPAFREQTDKDQRSSEPVPS